MRHAASPPRRDLCDCEQGISDIYRTRSRALSDTNPSGNYGDMTIRSVFTSQNVQNSSDDFSLNSVQTLRKIRGKNHVKFDPCVKVVLIAGREEYKEAGIDGSLWYFRKDFSQFKLSALLRRKSKSLIHNLPKEALISVWSKPSPCGESNRGFKFTR